MSEISTTIRVNDGFSRAFKAMNSALDTVMNSLKDTQAQLGKPFDMTAFKAARKELARVNTALDDMGREAREAAISMQNNTNAATGFLGKIKGLVAAYAGFEGAKSLMNMADTYASINSRLNLMQDGLTSTAQLEEMIRQSADRTRSSFQDSADMVGKLGVQAKAAFNNSADVVNFVEQLNKHLIISGTNAQAAQGGLLQMTQAMGAGVLRGEELNSIMESMPTVAKTIEKYFNEVLGDNRAIKKIAEDGKISAKIVKDALYWAADDINKQFEGMQVTFGNLWTLFKNQANKALTPVFTKLTALSSAESFKNFAINAGNAVGILGAALSKVLDGVKAVYNFIKSNWSFIAPVIMGIVSALAIYKMWLGYVKVAEMISAGVKLVSCIASYALAAATGKQASATAVATAKQWGLNAALLASPWTWVILAIIAVIAALYLGVAAFNKLTDSSVSATGLIAGAFAWLGALIANIFIGIWNILSGIVQAIVNAWKWCAENINSVFYNIGVWWSNLWIDAKIGFYNFLNDVMSGLASLAKKMGPIADLLDIDLSGFTGSIGNKISSLESSKKQYKGYTAFKAINWESVDYLNLSDAYDKGYNWGEGLADKVSDFFSGDNLTKEIGDALGLDSLSNLANTGTGATDAVTGKDAVNNATNPNLRGSGGYGTALDKIADNTDKLVDNTAKDRELEVMRELGTREAVNRFTTAQIRVMQTNNNNMSKADDADSILARLAKGLRDAMNVAAEGVY